LSMTPRDGGAYVLGIVALRAAGKPHVEPEDADF
jgi:hypothetical protein